MARNPHRVWTVTRGSTLDLFLRRNVDPILERVMGLAVRVRMNERDPVRTRLAPFRREAMLKTLAEYAPRARELPLSAQKNDPRVLVEYDRLVGEAMARMRSLGPAEVEPGQGLRQALDGTTLLAALDRPLYRNEPEVMDDPDFPEDERASALDVLDRLNLAAGSYDQFIRIMAPLLEAAEQGGRVPVRVHDIASGHGGFSLHLKQRLRDRATVEASDVMDEYLALGRCRALTLGLDVRFAICDALELAPLGARGVDVITCTQSLHHFTPGMVARMVGEAARNARVGACLIDGERSWFTYGVLTPIAALYGRTYAFVHDAAVSIRRSFYEEELALLAGLAPGVPETARFETGIAPPAHTFIRIRHAAAA